eukprot:360885-Chlamydomonas_euryale.AAC.2
MGLAGAVVLTWGSQPVFGQKEKGSFLLDAAHASTLKVLHVALALFCLQRGHGIPDHVKPHMRNAIPAPYRGMNPIPIPVPSHLRPFYASLPQMLYTSAHPNRSTHTFTHMLYTL